jgi:ferredoxin
MTRLTFSRRDFVLGAVAGTAAGAGIVTALFKRKSPPDLAYGSNSVFHTDRAGRITTPSFIAVDYARCSGCRICEAECAWSAKSLLTFSAAEFGFIGFEPALDIVSLCAGCADAPCVSVCPKRSRRIEPRFTMTGAILLDESSLHRLPGLYQSLRQRPFRVIRMSRDGKKHSDYATSAAAIRPA